MAQAANGKKSHEFYCGVLGVEPDAPMDQIKKKYRDQMKRWHTDINGNAEEAKEQAQLLNETMDYFKSEEANKARQESQRQKQDKSHKRAEEARRKAKEREDLRRQQAESERTRREQEERKKTQADNNDHTDAGSNAGAGGNSGPTDNCYTGPTPPPQNDDAEQSDDTCKPKTKKWTYGKIAACVVAATFLIQPIISGVYRKYYEPKTGPAVKAINRRLADSGSVAMKKMASDAAVAQAGKMTLSDMKKAADKLTNAQFKGRAEQLMSHKENEKGFFKIYEQKYKVATTVPAPNGVDDMTFDRLAFVHFSAEPLTGEDTAKAVKKANLTGTNPVGYKLNTDVVYYSTTAKPGDKDAPKPVLFEPDPKKDEDGKKAYSDYMHDMFSESNTIIYFGPTGTEKVILDSKGEEVKPAAPAPAKKAEPARPDAGKDKSKGKPPTQTVAKTFG